MKSVWSVVAFFRDLFRHTVKFLGFCCLTYSRRAAVDLCVKKYVRSAADRVFSAEDVRTPEVMTRAIDKASIRASVHIGRTDFFLEKVKVVIGFLKDCLGNRCTTTTDRSLESNTTTPGGGNGGRVTGDGCGVFTHPRRRTPVHAEVDA